MKNKKPDVVAYIGLKRINFYLLHRHGQKYHFKSNHRKGHLFGFSWTLRFSKGELSFGITIPKLKAA